MTMTDATSTTRTYAVGDTLDVADYRADDYCGARVGSGYTCSMPNGHTGPQHVAAYYNREVCGVEDRDTSGDPIEGTWEPGDMVQALPGLPVANVLSVARDEDGIVRAWMVGQRDGDDTWRLIKSPVDALSPHTGSHIGPTLADIGAALVAKATTMDADVESNRRARREAEAERDATNEAMDTLKREVVRVAMENAREHNWCGVVTRALRDMDLGDYLTQRYQVQVELKATRTIYVEVEASDAESAWRSVDEMSESELSEAYERYDGNNLYRYVLADGWSHDSHDSSTDVTNLDD
jgi:hypothetical protein